MAGLDRDLVTRVQQANDIVDVVSEHVSLTKKGREMVGLCPFHDDHSPSFFVSPAKQIFKCFPCGAGGDVIKFVQMRENLSFGQALERLAERAGIQIQLPKYHHTDKDKSTDIDPNRLAKANLWAMNHFKKNLADPQKGKIAIDYLSQRQINAESIEKWRLGYAAENDDIVNTARAANASLEMLSKAGLAIQRPGEFADRLTNRLIFPITDVAGRVIGFGARTLDGSGAKYINSPTTPLFDKSNCLYGLEQARHEIVSQGYAVVVEGYTDVIMAHQFGCRNVIATLGTSFTEGHARIIRRFARKIMLLFDSDIAGTEAANRALDMCLLQNVDIRIAFVQESKDPCDFLLKAGKDGFDKLMEDAIDVFEFKWDRICKKFHSGDTMTDQKAAADEYLQTLAIAFSAGNLDPIQRGLLINRISRIVGISDQATLTNNLLQRAKRTPRASAAVLPNSKVVSFTPDSLYRFAQREILEVLLNAPQLYGDVCDRISINDFDTPELKMIAGTLFERFSGGQKIALTDILSGIESVEYSNLVIELSEAGEKKGNYSVRLNDAVLAIEQSRCEQEGQRIKETDGSLYLKHISQKASAPDRRKMGMR
ncbi:MAG: DNA primase [Phycisphaerae bacterium]|nr:DNA primase [Phycisphaerae bacterium]